MTMSEQFCPAAFVAWLEATGHTIYVSGGGLLIENPADGEPDDHEMLRAWGAYRSALQGRDMLKRYCITTGRVRPRERAA
jgi:hypothetical protein